MSELDTHLESDYAEYINYTAHRTSIIDSGFESDIKDLYRLLYIFSSNIYIYRDIDKKSFMWNYISETKNDLIISFDLLNINYMTASKRILRSAIESFFRFSLCFARFDEYSQNKKAGIFQATEVLKQLKSMSDTHKVGKMTFYVSEYFQSTKIESQINKLYDKYSSLSSIVHVNSKTDFSPQRFLSQYASIIEDDVRENVRTYKEIMLLILLCLYYFETKLSESTFSKITILTIESIGGEEAKLFFDQCE
ncbi:hypothetical protein MXF21_11600 [Enterococcus casseliflavus]|uniref:hypothetical protein n=1 Tax=Enterococcus casseliflavus TaxID=37734 RepID=UPI002DBFE1D3|nr:hypothetical protein [Enterococcus casseliflavus]MEB6086759.1 hypothetical protein [Enterococcus casseliflavus]